MMQSNLSVPVIKLPLQDLQCRTSPAVDGYLFLAPFVPVLIVTRGVRAYPRLRAFNIQRLIIVNDIANASVVGSQRAASTYNGRPTKLVAKPGVERKLRNVEPTLMTPESLHHRLHVFREVVGYRRERKEGECEKEEVI